MHLESSLCMLIIPSLSDRISQSVACTVILLTGSFDGQVLLIFKFYLEFIYGLWFWCCYLRNHVLTPGHICFSYIYLGVFFVCLFVCFCFCFCFCCTHDMWKFLGQGLDPYHSNDPSCYRDNTTSLTHCTTRDLRIEVLNLNFNSSVWFILS